MFSYQGIARVHFVLTATALHLGQEKTPSVSGAETEDAPRRLAPRFCCGSVFCGLKKMKIMNKKNTSPVRQCPARSSVSGAGSSPSSVGRFSSAPSSVLCPPSSSGSGSSGPSSLSAWARSVRLAGSFSRAHHLRHRSLSQQQVLAFIQQRIPRQWAAVEVIGEWVWVHVSRSLLELERSQLCELGFHFSPRRRAWQHPCGVPSSPSREPFARFRPAWVQ